MVLTTIGGKMKEISYRLEWFDHLTKTWVKSTRGRFDDVSSALEYASTELIHKYEETPIKIIAYKEEIVHQRTLKPENC